MTLQQQEEIYNKLSEADRKKFAIIGIGYTCDVLSRAIKLLTEKGFFTKEDK